MPMRAGLAALSVLAVLAGCASTPPEEDPVQQKLSDLEGRTERTERSVNNQVAVSQHVDEMQAQLRELQGRIDELEHANQTLMKQQRDLYADLDKRLGGGAAGTAGAAAPVSSSKSRRSSNAILLPDLSFRFSIGALMRRTRSRRIIRSKASPRQPM